MVWVNFHYFLQNNSGVATSPVLRSSKPQSRSERLSDSQKWLSQCRPTFKFLTDSFTDRRLSQKLSDRLTDSVTDLPNSWEGLRIQEIVRGGTACWMVHFAVQNLRIQVFRSYLCWNDQEIPLQVISYKPSDRRRASRGAPVLRPTVGWPQRRDPRMLGSAFKKTASCFLIGKTVGWPQRIHPCFT